jgi:hypothetical protein
MAEVDEKVMKFVEETLKKSPDLALEEIFQRAKSVSPSVAELSKRQFNARYPLQVKRRKAQAAKPKRSTGKRAAALRTRTQRTRKGPARDPRDNVRKVFLRFATDIAAAEERKDLVKVVAGVDWYVDQVLKGLTKD